MPATANKRKAMTKPQREQLLNWLRFYDRWLWQMRVDSKKACEYATSDGLAFATALRLSIYAKRDGGCERWKVEKVSTSRKFMLTGGGWSRVTDWVEKNRDAVIESGCVVAANTLAKRAGVRCADMAMHEALKGRGIALPFHAARQKYLPTIPASPAVAKGELCLSPVMNQWRAFNRQHTGYIILIRIGDFYETFHSDAETLAKVLGVAVTTRCDDVQGEVRMAGVPAHAIEGSLRKLIAAGHKVALAEPTGEGGRRKAEITRMATEASLV